MMLRDAARRITAFAHRLYGPRGQRVVHFLGYLLRRVQLDRAPNTAASLAFTTLFALVPLMAVVLSIFSAFPVFEDLSDQIRDYAFEQFVPGVGDAVQEHLEQFVAGAGQLTAVGTIFLVVAALLLMNTIDHAFNEIWGIREDRHPVALFMVYWAVLTLGPLLLGFSVAISSYLFSLPLFRELDGGANLTSGLLSIVPLLFSALAFTLLYAVVPNRRVPWRNAIIGGVCAALLFEGAKWGFARYVSMVPTYELVYGALSTLPFLMIWLYVVWLITLLGVEISRCLTLYPQEALENTVTDPLLTAYRGLARLYEAQLEGGALSPGELLEQEPDLDEQVVHTVMERLRQQRLVHCTASGDWILARDADRVTLLDLYLALTDWAPRPPAHAGRRDEPLRRALEAGWGELAERLTVPLSQLFQADVPQQGPEPPAYSLSSRRQ